MVRTYPVYLAYAESILSISISPPLSVILPTVYYIYIASIRSRKDVEETTPNQPEPIVYGGRQTQTYNTKLQDIDLSGILSIC